MTGSATPRLSITTPSPRLAARMSFFSSNHKFTNIHDYLQDPAVGIAVVLTSTVENRQPILKSLTSLKCYSITIWKVEILLGVIEKHCATFFQKLYCGLHGSVPMYKPYKGMVQSASLDNCVRLLFSL